MIQVFISTHQLSPEPSAAQDLVSLPCCKDTFLAPVPCVFQQDPQVVFCQAVFAVIGSQHKLLAPSHLQEILPHAPW